MKKSTQLHDAFIDYARQRHRLYFVVIGCSEIMTIRPTGRLALNTCIPMRLFTLEFANSCSVSFICCEQASTELTAVKRQGSVRNDGAQLTTLCVKVPERNVISRHSAYTHSIHADPQCRNICRQNRCVYVQGSDKDR